MSIGIDKLAHMNTPALSDILLAHSAAEGTGVIAIGDLPKLLNAGNLKYAGQRKINGLWGTYVSAQEKTQTYPRCLSEVRFAGSR